MDAARRGDADGQPAAETAGRGDSAAAAGPAPPACYLIVHSVAKKHNGAHHAPARRAIASSPSQSLLPVHSSPQLLGSAYADVVHLCSFALCSQWARSPAARPPSAWKRCSWLVRRRRQSFSRPHLGLRRLQAGIHAAEEIESVRISYSTRGERGALEQTTGSAEVGYMVDEQRQLSSVLCAL